MVRNAGSIPVAALLWGAWGAAIAGASAGEDGPRAPAPVAAVDYLRDIRPILSDHCYPCHGPDAETREAGLRLDTRDGAFGAGEAGHPAVVPFDLEGSELFYRITAESTFERMPPEAGKPLDAGQVERIRAWIEQGAPWGDHWSFQTPTRSPVPEPAAAARARGELDRFVLERLEHEGLDLAPEADRETLVRRVSLDLTGLPPSVEELDAFLADDDPAAYERLVDRLLESPRYGEHMARPWLDAARYGDTHGYHLDNERSLWRWREWVIDALNDNMPFDQFTVEQLAGDLLPEPTTEQLIATGFNRCNPTTGEGGLIEEEYLAKYAMDRVDTTATVWMGVTLGCAQCHDHKFDPLSQRDYYRFFAFFHSIAEEGTDRNALAPPPSLPIPSAEQRAALADLEQRLHAVAEQQDGPMPATDRAQAEWEAEAARRLTGQWTVVTPEARSEQGATLTVLEDQSVLASGENPAHDVYEITLRTTQPRVTGLRLEALTHDSLPLGGIGRAHNSNIALTQVEWSAAPLDDPSALTPVPVALAAADYSQRDWDITAAIDDDPRTGWAVDARPENRVAYFVPAWPIDFPEGVVLRVRLHFGSIHGQHAIGRLRLALSADETLNVIRRGPWSVAGPFAAATADAAHETAFGPEESPDSVSTEGGGDWAWQERADLADGAIHEFEGDLSAVYLRRVLESPDTRLLTATFGSDDALKVWLNGELVLDRNVRRAVAADQDRLDLKLRPGANVLLCKVTNELGGFAFTFRVASEDLGGVDPALAALLARPAAERSEADRDRLRDGYRRRHSAEWRALEERRLALLAEKAALEASIPVTMISRELAEPRQAHVLVRGQYDHKGEPVEPGIPAALGAPAEPPRTRLDLARWLVSGHHPLTARVAVNRAWQHFFGTGLVKTAEDFGAQGEWPSHPALLDWLACEFVDGGWDVKALHRRIVTSATYRQSARVRPEARAKDPGNRWLAHAPRPRLDAEVIRDAALFVSGLLVEKIGGPSVKPYQPAGLWKAVGYTSSNTANFRQDQGDALYRRSLYTFWKRTSPPPSLQCFDAPSRESCVVRRSRTNTPLQALALMNDVQYVEASRAFAGRLLEVEADTDARLVRGFRMVTGRRPEAGELAGLREFLRDAEHEFAGHVEAAQALRTVGDRPAAAELDPVQEAAWTTVCNLLLNLDEFVTRN